MWFYWPAQGGLDVAGHPIGRDFINVWSAPQLAMGGKLATPATLINTIGGQTGFLSASLFLGGILQLNRRPILAGVLFGLLTFKPHLGLVLPFCLLALGA